MPPHTPAEIIEADLAPLALDLAEWGISDPATLRWLDLPPAATFAQARDLLLALEALDANGRINAHGRALARLGTHPRLAHMIVRGAELGLAGTAIRIAAVLGERDLLRSVGPDRDVDLRLRIEALLHGRNLPAGMQIDMGARQRVLRSIELLERQAPRSCDRASQPVMPTSADCSHSPIPIASRNRVAAAESIC